MLPVKWLVKEETGELRPYILMPDDSLTEIIWAPQEGSQVVFLQCPVFEALYESNRGSGKTDSLLLDYAQHVGKGYGREWKGILFRNTYKQLKDVLSKSVKLFSGIFPGAKFNKSEMEWTFPAGETLMLRYMDNADDYWNYHGWNIPWIAWEELTNWPTPDCYTSMMSCCRSAIPNIPLKYRATTNPYGRGHSWIKRRFRLPVPTGSIIGPVIVDSKTFDGGIEPPRVAIHGQLSENKVLLHADPNYINRLRASARNEGELNAWVYGSWDITSGGMFDDLWTAEHHVIPAGLISPMKVPKSWRIDRSFDWGSSKPFSVGWWAESDGTAWELKGGQKVGTVRGDIIRIAEWYGCVEGEENEGVRITSSRIADGIKLREIRMGIHGRVQPGPADNSIFDALDGNSIAAKMEGKGIYWTRSDKSPGSRKNGWDAIRNRLEDSIPPEGNLPREHPGLFIAYECSDFRRTVPALPRDAKDPDDVDTEVEDHIADEVRYRLYNRSLNVGVKRVTGR